MLFMQIILELISLGRLGIADFWAFKLWLEMGHLDLFNDKFTIPINANNVFRSVAIN